MDDSKIIEIFIRLAIPDNHPIVYQYIKGRDRSKATALNRLGAVCYDYLSPPYTIGHIKTVGRRFLKEKEAQYKRGEIEIKPIY
jgi:hypothetical protein